MNKMINQPLPRALNTPTAHFLLPKIHILHIRSARIFKRENKKKEKPMDYCIVELAPILNNIESS